MTESYKVDELLQRNENHIREVGRRSRFHTGMTKPSFCIPLSKNIVAKSPRKVMKFWFFGFGRETIAKDFFLGVENPFHIAEMQSRQIIVQAFKQANLEYNSLLSVLPLFAFFIQHHVLNINCIKKLKKKEKEKYISTWQCRIQYDYTTQIRYKKNN